MSDSQDENLKTTYDQLCTSYRAIDDFRAKLLGFLPLASGTGIFLLIPDNSTSPLNTYLGPVGVFGALITFGLFLFEIYGIKKCHGLIKAGQQIEDQMGIRGQFKERPREVAGFINEPFAAGVIYPAVLAAWTFLALQGQPPQRPGDQKTDFTWEIDPTDVGIPIGVFFVGLVCSFAYNRWLRKERPFLAELFDSKGDELDKRLLVSHTFSGSLESAKKYWARKDENATFIRLTDATDVEKKTKTYVKASAQGEWKKPMYIEDSPVPQRSYYSSIENADWEPLNKKGQVP
jgi:hypothetical protein